MQQAGIRRRQGAAVELAVGGQRHALEQQQVRRDHVLRQVLAQRGLDRLTPDRLVGHRLPGHQVADQLVPLGPSWASTTASRTWGSACSRAWISPSSMRKPRIFT